MAYIISGTDGLPAGGVAQEDLAANVGGTGPAFSVNTCTTNIAANATNTVMKMTGILGDTNTYYSSATGRFTPLVAGWYQFNGAISFGSTASSGQTTLLRKNGSITFGQAAFPTVANSWVAASCSGAVFLNGSTDFVELVGYVAAGAPFNVVDANFSGVMVRKL